MPSRIDSDRASSWLPAQPDGPKKEKREPAMQNARTHRLPSLFLLEIKLPDVYQGAHSYAS